MTLNFFTTLTLISVFLTIILTLFFFVTKKGFRFENKILATLLVIFNLQILYSFMTSNFTYQYFMNWHKSIFLVRQTSLLIGPLIYFYINSFLKRKNIFNYRSLFHFLPFIFAILFLLIFYINKQNFVIWEETNLSLYNTIIILAHNFTYLVMSVISLKSININFSSFFKSIKISTPTTWLQIILLGFIIIWIVNLNSWAIIMIVKKPSWCAYTASIYALIAFLFINSIMFLLLLNPDIYYIITKYKKNKLDEETKSEYLQKLNSYMEINKPFFNSEITLEFLANEISINPRILSQIINETFNKTFKSYILEFRIKESMQILSDAKYSKLTILEILYKVGFNTKSAFNNQFKLYTNLTPQEYRSKFMTEKKHDLVFS